MRLKPIFACGLALCAAFLGWAAHAATFTMGPIQTSATVPDTLSLNVLVLDASSGSALTSIDFGRLDYSGSELTSARSFRVLLQVNAQGSAYEIKQQASPLKRNGGPEELPAGSLVAEPSYLETDNGGLPAPAGLRLSSPDSVENMETVVADPSGSSRTVSVAYKLAPNGGQPISVFQRSGDYSGTIQYTLVTS